MSWAAVGTTPADADSPSVEVHISSRNYDARETSAGLQLNHEEGTLHGLAFTVAADGWRGRWSLLAADESGTLLYQGQSQVGLPLITLTDLNVQRVALRWTPAWHPNLGPASFEGHTEVAHQSIERAIRRGPFSLPLTENLQALWLRGGATVHLPLLQHWSMQAGAQVSWPLAQQLRVDTFTVYDKFMLKPRSRLSLRLNAAIAWYPRADLRISLQASHERWRFGPAAERPIYRDAVLAGDAGYPGSRQRLTGYELSLTHWF